VPVAVVERSSPLRGIEFESRREEEEEEEEEEEGPGRVGWRFEFGDNAEDAYASYLGERRGKCTH
jgi:hypothetical protein